MNRPRSRLRAGAVVFALLSVALHAAVWQAGRRAAPQADAEAQASVALRLVTLPAPEPVRPAAPPESRARQSVASPKKAPSAPRPTAARPVVKKPQAKRPPSRIREAQAPRSDPAAWSRPLAVPEFYDPFDASAALDAAVNDTPGTPANDTLAAPADDATATSASGTTAHEGQPHAPAPTASTSSDEAPAGRHAILSASARLEAALAPPEALPVVPAHGSVRYRVHYGDPADGNVVAMLEQHYDIDNDRYRLRSEGRATGVASWFYRGTLLQESSGRVSALGLQPERYRERRGERNEKEAVVDAEGERVRFASGASAALPPGAQDRLSVFVQIGLLLQSDPSRFTPGAVVVLPVLASSRVESSAFRVLGNEIVGAGEEAVAALRLRREPHGEEPAIDLWLALEPRVLPLRVRITEASGRALDQIVVGTSDVLSRAP